MVRPEWQICFSNSRGLEPTNQPPRRVGGAVKNLFNVFRSFFRFRLSRGVSQRCRPRPCARVRARSAKAWRRLCVDRSDIHDWQREGSNR